MDTEGPPSTFLTRARSSSLCRCSWGLHKCTIKSHTLTNFVLLMLKIRLTEALNFTSASNKSLRISNRVVVAAVDPNEAITVLGILLLEVRVRFSLILLFITTSTTTSELCLPRIWIVRSSLLNHVYNKRLVSLPVLPPQHHTGDLPHGTAPHQYDIPGLC